MCRLLSAALFPALLLAGCGSAGSTDVWDAGPAALEDKSADAPEQEPVDEEPVDEEPVDEEPVVEEPVVEEPVVEEPVVEEPVDAGPLDVEPADAGFAPPAPMDAGFADPAPEPAPSSEAEMTYVTANIGRTYDGQSDVQAVFDHVGDVIGPKPGPKYIGWQEIGEGDPCGSTCEYEALGNRFQSASGWANRRPEGETPSGDAQRVKVPVTSKGAGDGAARATYASAGWAGVSPTRFVTVVHYAERNVSVINTHLIAGAWSCKSHVAQRREYWHSGWTALKDAVAEEHDLGRNVVVTGDLNRPRGANSCNPAWDPTSLHEDAKIIGGQGIDYVFAVPAAGNGFVVSTRPDGTKKRGSIGLGIDGHRAHWVSGRFGP